MNISYIRNEIKNKIRYSLIEILGKNNLKLRKDSSFEDVLLNFLSLEKKIIKAKKRKVFFSKEFLMSKMMMSDEKMAESLDSIIIDTTLGNDLNKYQSKRLTQMNFHDHLVYEWGIYHLHVSNMIMKKYRFVKQVNTLAFMFIRNEFAIFLDLSTHKKGLFGDKYWIEILHHQFPWAVENYKLNSDIISISSLSSIERQILWDKGISSPIIDIDGYFYFSSGVGRVSTGHSLVVARTVDSIITWINETAGLMDSKLDHSKENPLDDLNARLDAGRFIITCSSIDLKSIF